MAVQDIWDWLALVLGGMLIAMGLAALLWALFRDRSRKRQRCPRCWYDLAHITALPARCSECGRRIKSLRALRRTRRHKRAAAAAALLLLLGAALASFPFGRDGGWVRWVPDTVLIAALPEIDADWPMTELLRRFNSDGTPYEYSGGWTNGFDRLWSWQWRLLAVQTGRLAASDAPLPRRQDALVVLLQRCPDPSPAAPALVRCLADPQWRQRWLASWGIKANRHTLSAAARAQILPALEALRTDSEPRVVEGADLAIKALNFPPASPEAETAPLTPESLEPLLHSANSATIGLIFKRLRANPHTLLWAYDGDGGPYQVTRFDLEIDGKPGLDRILLIGDQWGAHYAALVWLRRGKSWRFADGLGLANSPGSKPQFSTISAPGSPTWLVCRRLAGHTGDSSYRLFENIYFTVHPGSIRVAGLAWASGHQTRTATKLPHTPLNWTLTSSTPRALSASGKPTIEFDVEAAFTGITLDTWPPDMPARTELFQLSQTVRLRPDRYGWLVPDPQTPWADQAVVTRSMLEGAPAFITEQYHELWRLATQGTPEQRRWLKLFLTDCANTPTRDGLLQALDAPPAR